MDKVEAENLKDICDEGFNDILSKLNSICMQEPIKSEEATMPEKREAMEMCHEIIPMMNKNEISILFLALGKTVQRLLDEGRVY